MRMCAATRERFSFGSQNESAAQPGAAMVLRDPELLDKHPVPVGKPEQPADQLARLMRQNGHFAIILRCAVHVVVADQAVDDCLALLR